MGLDYLIVVVMSPRVPEVKVKRADTDTVFPEGVIVVPEQIVNVQPWLFL